MATKALIFFPALSGLRFDGAALASGRLFFFEPGTTTQRQTWANRNKTVVSTTYSEAIDETGPFYVRLDANGQAEIFLDGVYDVVIKDSNSVTKATWEGYEGTPGSGSDNPPVEIPTTGGNVVQTLPTDTNTAVTYVKTTDDVNVVTFTTSDGSTIAEPGLQLSSQFVSITVKKTGTVWYRV